MLHRVIVSTTGGRPQLFVQELKKGPAPLLFLTSQIVSKLKNIVTFSTRYVR